MQVLRGFRGRMFTVLRTSKGRLEELAPWKISRALNHVVVNL